MASLAWLFDCLDQQLFILARPAAMKAVLRPDLNPNVWGGYATAIFVAGWAMGGLIFGAVGDRIGRARTLTITILMYSVCTGLSAFSKGFFDFALYRFITGLGVGGVFGLAVALVADSLPDAARPARARAVAGAFRRRQRDRRVDRVARRMAGNVKDSAGQCLALDVFNRRIPRLSLRLFADAFAGAGEMGQGARRRETHRRALRIICRAPR
jgi:hypothetical protein